MLLWKWDMKFKESEMTILRRTEKAMVRSMCEVKLVNRKNIEDLMEMLGLKKTLDRMVKARLPKSLLNFQFNVIRKYIGVRWYGHVMRRDDDNMQKKAMMLEVKGQRKRGRPKMTWRRQVEESVKKFGLKIKEVADRTRCREGVRAIAEEMRCIPLPLMTRKIPHWNWTWWWWKIIILKHLI